MCSEHSALEQGENDIGKCNVCIDKCLFNPEHYMKALNNMIKRKKAPKRSFDNDADSKKPVKITSVK